MWRNNSCGRSSRQRMSSSVYVMAGCQESQRTEVVNSGLALQGESEDQRSGGPWLVSLIDMIRSRVKRTMGRLDLFASPWCMPQRADDQTVLPEHGGLCDVGRKTPTFARSNVCVDLTSRWHSNKGNREYMAGVILSKAGTLRTKDISFQCKY